MPKNIEDKVNEDKSAVVETAAADTLRPQSQTRAGMMSDVMGMMSGMTKSDLISFFQASMDQFGAGKSDMGSIPLGTAEKNQASIATKEDVEEVLAGDEAITEDTKEKIAVIFEAHVGLKVQEKVAQLEEEFATKLEEAITASETALAEKVDTYLTVAAEEWLTENELAVENGIRSEILESFMAGMKALFESHNIDIPEVETNILADLQLKVEELSSELDEVCKENMKLKNKIKEDLDLAARSKVFESATAGLAQTQIAKFKTLAENISYTSSDDFQKKITMIKEQYFSAPSSKLVLTEEVIGVADLNGEEEKNVIISSDPNVAAVVQALSKSKR